MRKLVLLSIAPLLAVLCLHLDVTDAQCCHAKFLKCGDGTPGTPCCGYRPCNLFCCACKGGCRHHGKREAPDTEDVSEEQDEGSEALEDPFVKYDEDKDGQISLGEARRWLIAGGCGNPFVKIMAVSSDFQNMDTNQDGGLDRQEIGG